MVALVRIRPQPIAFAAALAAAAALATGSAASARTVTCPASAASSLGPVQWAFTGLGAPSASGAGIRNSWFRGNGTWNAGRAVGTICADDSGGGRPKSRIVLRVSGASTLSPGIVKLGLKGVGIVIPVRVSATDDHACPAGTTGTITLFASYYSVHRDSMAAHFHGGCADHDLTFTGMVLRVEIQRNGAQVNSS